MISCPYCKFPLASRGVRTDFAPGSGSVRYQVMIACSTCRAVLNVSIAVVQEPAESWAENDNRRVNQAGPPSRACPK